MPMPVELNWLGSCSLGGGAIVVLLNIECADRSVSAMDAPASAAAARFRRYAENPSHPSRSANTAPPPNTSGAFSSMKSGSGSGGGGGAGFFFGGGGFGGF